MSATKVKITLVLSIEQPTRDIAGSLGSIRKNIEDAASGELAKVCWQYGTFTDAEVKNIEITESFAS
jgi:hypothetical protein